MKSTFHHHPDGVVYIKGLAGTYNATLDGFQLDLAFVGLPVYPPLPDGVVERRYIVEASSRLHALHTVDSQLDGGSPWSAGDAYLQALEQLIAASAQRESPPKTIEQMRASKNAEINAARLKANFTAFEHAGKLIACDTLSRSDIDGVAAYVALHDALPPDFPGAWKALDNTYVPIPNVDALKAMVGSMAARGIANFMHAQELKQQLAAADTPAAIDAIEW